MKVAILGKDTNLPDVETEGFELWGFNYPRPWEKRVKWDRRFELHQRSYLEEVWPEGQLAEYEEWLAESSTLNEYQVTVWNPLEWFFMPHLNVYPKDEVEKITPHGDYHCGSFDWIVSYAILLRVEQIDMYGMNMSVTGTGGEPISARACLEYWLGVAEGRGIKVRMSSLDIFKNLSIVERQEQYGFDNINPARDLHPYPKIK